MTARVQADNLLAGMDLDLYQPREFLMMFWYLDYLLSQCGDYIKAWALLHPQGGLRDRNDSSRVLAYLKQAVPLEAVKWTCTGLMRAIVGLQLAGSMPERAFPFNSAMETFDQRFSPLHANQHPAPLWYEDFRDTTRVNGLPPPKLYLMAIESLTQAGRVCETFRQKHGDRATPEELEELGLIARVATQNATALTLLARTAAAQGPAATSAFSISWEFTQHPQLPVMALRSAKKPAAGAK